MASNNTGRSWKRLAIYGGIIGVGLLGVQLALTKIQHDALLPPPGPVKPKTVFPDALPAMQKALEQAPSRHIVGRFPLLPTMRYESWHQGKAFRHDNTVATYSFDGKRYWLHSPQQKLAWVSSNADDLSDQHPNLKNTHPYPTTLSEIDPRVLANSDRWSADKSALRGRLLPVDDNSNPRDITVTLDPATGRPLEETFLGLADRAVGMSESAFGAAAPPPVGGQPRPRRPRPRPTPDGGPTLLAQYNYDFAPIPEARFRPTLPQGTTLYDIDKIRTAWKGPLTNTLARLKLGGKELLIHNVQINAWGDVSVFYSGRLPLDFIAVKQPDGKNSQMYGYLQVEDSLGRVSPPPPNVKDIFGKLTSQRPPVVSTSPNTAYEFYARNPVSVMNTVLPPPPPGSGDGISVFTITCHTLQPDPRPRAVTLRWLVYPRDPSAEIQTLEYKSGPLTPQPAPEVLVPTFYVSPEPATPENQVAMARRFATLSFRDKVGHPPTPTELDALFAEFQQVGKYDTFKLQSLYDWNQKLKRSQQALQVAQYAFKIRPNDAPQTQDWEKTAKTGAPAAAGR